MKCGKARDRFSAYLDKDLTFEEEGRLEEHLCGCSECAEELDKLTRVQGLLRSLAPVEVSEDFCDRVQRRVREAQDRPETEGGGLRAGTIDMWRWWRGQVWLRPALGAALGLVAGLLVGVTAPQLVGHPRGATSPPTEMAAARELPSPGSSVPTTSARDAGPFSGIDLTHLASVSDSARAGSAPEYVLEPYLTDPQRGLIPAAGTYGRTAGADWDSQNDAFIAF